MCPHERVSQILTWLRPENLHASKFRDSAVETGFRDTPVAFWETILGRAEFVSLTSVSELQRITCRSHNAKLEVVLSNRSCKVTAHRLTCLVTLVT